MTDRELMQQALEALELHAKQYPHMQKGYTVDAITALREALADQPAPMIRGDIRDGLVDDEPAQQQEPVAWRFTGIAGLKRYMTQKHYDAQTPETKKWYEPFRCANCTTPPPAQPQQEPVAWADMEVRGEDKGLSWTQRLFRKTPLYTHHAPVNQQLLEDIAEVAHCGGLAGMSEGDALISIRKLTLPHWRKERTIEQARAAIAAAEGKV